MVLEINRKELSSELSNILELADRGVALIAIIGRSAWEIQPRLPEQNLKKKYVCVDPWFDHYKKKRGPNWTLPCEPLSLDFANEDLNLIPNETFGTIVFDFSVFNHMGNEWETAIFEWSRILKSGGELYIAGELTHLVPGFEAEWRRYNAARGDEDYVGYDMYVKSDDGRQARERLREKQRREFHLRLKQLGRAAGFISCNRFRLKNSNYPIKFSEAAESAISPDTPFYVLKKDPDY